MQQELTDILARIREYAVDLNTATDDAAAVVAQVEKELEECGIGIPAVADDTCEVRLVYARINGRFRIGVVFDDNGFKCTQAWAETTRMNKLCTYPRLAQLLRAIAGWAEALTCVDTE